MCGSYVCLLATELVFHLLQVLPSASAGQQEPAPGLAPGRYGAWVGLSLPSALLPGASGRCAITMGAMRFIGQGCNRMSITFTPGILSKPTHSVCVTMKVPIAVTAASRTHGLYIQLIRPTHPLPLHPGSWSNGFNRSDSDLGTLLPALWAPGQPHTTSVAGKS
jgi:hypothetical protein